MWEKGKKNYTFILVALGKVNNLARILKKKQSTSINTSSTTYEKAK